MSLMSASIRSSQRVAGFGETVFATYSRLAALHGAINLGQGFPDFAPPDFVLAAYRRAAEGNQQYAPLAGVPALLETLAEGYGARLGRALEPAQTVLVTVGATEALFAVMQAFVDPGDEVVLLEPFYDAYPADVTMAGGAPRYVPLHPQEDGSWQLDLDELRRAFSDKTKLIVLNTPHNPTGKVFLEAELDAIIALAHEHDALIVSDEVYERISFAPHVSPAERPGGWERTLVISSLGKTFSVTGWKVGWVVGPEALVDSVRRAHQWIPFVVATPLQQAAADILKWAARPEDAYYRELLELYRRKRDLLVAALKRTPLRPLEPQGSYFVMADSSALDYPDGVALCQDLPERAGVAAIPASAFYSEGHQALAQHLVRFAFCKEDGALLGAASRLERLSGWVMAQCRLLS